MGYLIENIKTGSEVAEAFQLFMGKTSTISKAVDGQGKEFYNKQMKNLLEKNNVYLYSTKNEEKSSFGGKMESYNQTKMWKYFTANNTTTYINVLLEIIYEYNRTYYRSIKCKPTLAREPSNYQYVFESKQGDQQNKRWVIEFELVRRRIHLRKVSP